MTTSVQNFSVPKDPTSTLSEVKCRTRFCQRCENIPFDEGAFGGFDGNPTVSDTDSESLRLYSEELDDFYQRGQYDLMVDFELIDEWPQLHVISKSAENCDFCRLLETRLRKTDLPPEFRHAWIRVELFYCWWNRGDNGLAGLKAMVYGKQKRQDEYTRLVW